MNAVAMSLAPDDSQEDPMLPPPPMAAPLGAMMTSPFANRAQTQMASIMHTASIQQEESQ
jgi:hypothetical protein